MLHAMVAMFNSQTNSIGLAAAAAKAKFTEQQVITEASLLEAEVDPPVTTARRPRPSTTG